MSKTKRLQATTRTSKGIRNALFEQIDMLNNKEITIGEARAVSSLAKQILVSVKLEIDMQRFISETNRENNQLPVIEM